MNSSRFNTTRSLDGTEIGYVQIGAGPALVICHGGLFDMEDWFAVANQLAGRFTVHLYDRRGRGRSGDNPDGYSFASEQDDLLTIMRLAGPESILLGHSFGGTIVLAYALREKFKGHLIIHEAGLALREPFGGTPEAVKQLETLLAKGDFDAALSYILLEIAQYPPDTVTAFRLSPLWPKTAAMSSAFPREWRSINGFIPADEELAALSCRLTLLLGSETPRYPYRAIAADLVERIPGLSVVPLPGLNHAANLFAPEALAEHIANVIG